MHGNLTRGIAAALAVAAAGLLPEAGFAQQANIETPFNSAGHGFYEQIGVRWGLRGNGWFFNSGGLAPVPFGGGDPNAAANFGFSGPGGFFNLTAGQGSDRSLVSSSPSVTVMNGGQGYFSDTTQRPFVTGLVPVVGSPLGVPPIVPPFAPPQSALHERLERLQAEGAPGDAENAPDADAAPSASGPAASESSATRGDLSVAEIKAAKAAEKIARDAAIQEEIAVLLERAAGKLEAREVSVAKVYLQMAARKASGAQRTEILKRIESLEAAP
jgi:hypothetical protein